MNHHYRDITDKLGAPQWWDEHAVPRYCDFSPNKTANIYRREVVLLEIRCQDCERPFRVCMTLGSLDEARGIPSLVNAIRSAELHYGDPPNVGCCPAGPTMNSIPVRVLEFWNCRPFEAERVPELEIAIEPEWAS